MPRRQHGQAWLRTSTGFSSNTGMFIRSPNGTQARHIAHTRVRAWFACASLGSANRAKACIRCSVHRDVCENFTLHQEGVVRTASAINGLLLTLTVALGQGQECKGV